MTDGIFSTTIRQCSTARFDGFSATNTLAVFRQTDREFSLFNPNESNSAFILNSTINRREIISAAVVGTIKHIVPNDFPTLSRIADYCAITLITFTLNFNSSEKKCERFSE